MRSLPSKGTTPHFLRAEEGGFKEVSLQISWGGVEILAPKKNKEKNPIKGCYVRVWCEEEPDIEWILFTKSPITSLAEAREIVEIYKHRWLIEEYHKCLKTGCQIEEVQLRTANRILTLFGILGVIATQLIQLKGVSRMSPNEPAEKHVDKVAIAILEEVYSLKTSLTIGEFWKRVAMLAGFMGRKSDGSPGWKKIWEGWIKLRDMCKGVEIGRKLAARGV